MFYILIRDGVPLKCLKGLMTPAAREIERWECEQDNLHLTPAGFCALRP
jgi:hypothetical protein